MKMEFLEFENLQYVISYPAEYKTDKKYPVIIFLHGAGTRGNDIKRLETNPYFINTKKYESFPFVTVAPLCSENTWFDMFEKLKKLVHRIAVSDFADNERIYLMGVSMGGYATWQLAMSIPDYFAAVVPICGGGMYWNAARLVNVPVWAFHGEKDCTVFVEESKKMVEAVNKNGGNAKLTLYPENGHDSWTDTYNNYEVFEWLLSIRNNNSGKIIENFKDGAIYG